MGSVKDALHGFSHCIFLKAYFASIINQLSDYGTISYGVPEGSILGPLLLFICVNDMLHTVNSNFVLYASESCLTLRKFKRQ